MGDVSDQVDPVESGNEQTNNKLWRRVAVIAGLGVFAVGALVGSIFSDYVNSEAGPKNGIVFVRTRGCGEVSGIGPITLEGAKLLIRSFEAHGPVTVSLETQELPEAEVRDPGMLRDPSVTVSWLTIVCGDANSVEPPLEAPDFQPLPTVRS